MRNTVLIVLLFLVSCGSENGERDASTPDDADQSDSGDASDGGDDAEPLTCVRHGDCDDGLFCNGPERCDPDGAGADPFGCLPSPGDPCEPPETCVEEGNGRCVTPCEIEDDVDGDGHAAEACGGDDCDDDDANRFPGNTEVCTPDGDDPDTHDEDCDPATLGPDGDDDDFVPVLCCNEQPDGDLLCGGDCDDESAEVNPEAPESCNGIDDNCNGEADEGVRDTYYRDADEDGFGTDSDTRVGCVQPEGYVLVGGDCADDAPARHPGTTDVCNGMDDDCDPDIDEDATFRTYYRDGDIDGYGDDEDTVRACAAPDGYVDRGGDCADGNPARHPGLVDVCNEINDDCDEETDEDEPGVICYRDLDNDGFGDREVTETACSCAEGWTERAGPFDCHDDNDDVFPGQLDYFDVAYSTPGGGESFDYNCNSSENPEIDVTVRGACTPRPQATCGGSGWVGGPPACGASETWANCIWIPGVPPDPGRCVRFEADIVRTQRCR